MESGSRTRLLRISAHGGSAVPLTGGGLRSSPSTGADAGSEDRESRWGTRSLFLSRPDLEEEQAGEQLVVYDPDTRLVHLLNPAATVIYLMCDGRHDLDLMESEIRARYHVSELQDVRHDILEALARLHEENLLQGE